MPDGRTILVDAGSGGPMRLDAGERVVAPFLWNRGVLRLAGVAVTHDDADHAGGAAAVQRLFWIDERWTALSAPSEPRRFGRALVTPLPPPAAPGGDGTTRVWSCESSSGWPPSSSPPTSEPPASTSGGVRGALGVDGAQGRPPRLPLLDHRRVPARGPPDRGGDFGGSAQRLRPSRLRLLARLAEEGVGVYRTDRDGAVIFETDGGTLTVTRWAQRTVDRFCLEPEGIC